MCNFPLDVRRLDAARRLYDDAGFVLVEEQVGETWGTRVTEQRFVLVFDQK
jgi:hypothetical protein